MLWKHARPLAAMTIVFRMHNIRVWFMRVGMIAPVCGVLVACTTPAAQPPASVEPVLNVTSVPTQDTAATEAALQEEAIPTPVPREYTVKDGDTLSAIAARFGATVDDIIALNNIADPNALQVGQNLLIPGGALPTPSSNASAPLTDTDTLATPPGAAP